MKQTCLPRRCRYQTKLLLGPTPHLSKQMPFLEFVRNFDDMGFKLILSDKNKTGMQRIENKLEINSIVIHRVFASSTTLPSLAAAYEPFPDPTAAILVHLISGHQPPLQLAGTSTRHKSMEITTGSGSRAFATWRLSTVHSYNHSMGHHKNRFCVVFFSIRG